VKASKPPAGDDHPLAGGDSATRAHEPTIARPRTPKPAASKRSRQDLPADERSTVAALLRQLDFHGGELAVVDKELAAGRSLTR
jgi:hypothetical protein